MAGEPGNAHAEDANKVLDVEIQNDEKAHLTDPRKRKEDRRRCCCVWVVGIVTFLIVGMMLTIMSRPRRREMFMTGEQKFIRALYMSSPQRGDPFPPNITTRFPPTCSRVKGNDFLWGTMNAAFQVEGALTEGGRGESIWDALSRVPGAISNYDIPDVSADHYHQYGTDVDLMKKHGVRAYSFSVSWPRVIPDGKIDTPVNEEGLNFYRNLTDRLVKAGITPVVTLYHWDLPLALDNATKDDPRELGWTSPQIVGQFKKYAEVVFKALSPNVKHWITLHEPYSICQRGYASIELAPAKFSNPFRCGHHALLAHAEAVKSFRDGKYPGKIGITLNADFLQPMGPKDWKDVASADRLNQATIGWFAEPIFLGSYPPEMIARFSTGIPTFTPEQIAMVKGSADFLSISHFTSRYVFRVKNAAPETYAAKVMQYDWDGTPIGVPTGSNWLMSVPWGLKQMLRWLDHKYKKPEIWVQTGVSELNEDFRSDEQARNDTFRIQHHKNYMEEMCIAATSYGVNVKGHFVYSFLDGFEWRKGYTERFGLVHVNITTTARTPKNSLEWFRDFWAQAPGAAPPSG